MSARAEQMWALTYSALVTVVLVVVLMLDYGPQLSAALLAVIAADQTDVIAAVGGWSLAVVMGAGGLLALRWIGAHCEVGSNA